MKALNLVVVLVALFGMSMASGQTQPVALVVEVEADNGTFLESYDVENGAKLDEVYFVPAGAAYSLSYWSQPATRQLLLLQRKDDRVYAVNLDSRAPLEIRPARAGGAELRFFLGRDVNSSGLSDIVAASAGKRVWTWYVHTDPFGANPKVRRFRFGRSVNTPLVFRSRGKNERVGFVTRYASGRRARINSRSIRGGRVKRLRLPQDFVNENTVVITQRNENGRDLIVLVNSANGTLTSLSPRGSVIGNTDIPANAFPVVLPNADGEELYFFNSDRQLLDEQQALLLNDLPGTPGDSKSVFKFAGSESGPKQLSRNRPTPTATSGESATAPAGAEPTAVPSATPTSLPTIAPTATSTSTSTPTPVPTVTPTSTPTPTVTLTATATPTPTLTPSPTPLVTTLTITASSTLFSISSGSSPSSATVFTVNNTGNKTSANLNTVSITGTNPANFEIVTDSCTGSALSPAGSCSFSLRMTASVNASFSAEINVSDGDATASVSVSGTASGFAPVLDLSPGSSTGMDLTGVTTGSVVTFTLSNTGTASTAVLGAAALSGTNADKFEIVTDNCSGTTLAISANCTIDVRPVSSTNGAYTASLATGDNNVSSNSASLSGTASGLCDPVTTLPASGFYSNDFNTDISGWNRYGTSSTIDAADNEWGGTYASYWTPSLETGDRSLAFYKSNSNNFAGWEKVFTNTTGSTITSITVQFDIELSWFRFSSSTARNFDLDLRLIHPDGVSTRNGGITLSNSNIDTANDLTWICDGKSDALGIVSRNRTVSYSGLSIENGETFTLRIYDESGDFNTNRNIVGGFDNLIMTVAN